VEVNKEYDRRLLLRWGLPRPPPRTQKSPNQRRKTRKTQQIQGRPQKGALSRRRNNTRPNQIAAPTLGADTLFSPTFITLQTGKTRPHNIWKRYMTAMFC